MRAGEPAVGSGEAQGSGGDVGSADVSVRRGQFERGIARWVSWGPDLSVEIEVAGVRYGPSPIVANRYDPEWNYEFPRLVRWKLGDPVTIRVTDHDWKDRVLLELSGADDDQVAIRLLGGTVCYAGHQLTFESDFRMPQLPDVE